MIKINLVKSFYASSSDVPVLTDEQKNLQLNALKNLFVMCVGVGALYIYEMYNIPELNQQLSDINSEITEAVNFNQKMDGLKKEIERYEQDLKRLNSQTEFLQKVQKERTLSVDLINKMKDLVSPRVWLNSIEAVGNSIEIRGEAESIGDINEFNNKLAATSYLRDVVTISIESKSDYKIDVPIQSFNIKANYVDGKQLLDSTAPTTLESGVVHE